MLRDAWAERRQLHGVAGVHDFDSQFTVLRTLHGWAEGAADEIRAVYDDGLAISVSPAPEATTRQPAFSMTVGDAHTLTFILEERPRPGGSSWFISVTMSSGGPGGAIAAGPERRNGQWTRARLEEILLSVLGAYERANSEDARQGSSRSKARARGA